MRAVEGVGEAKDAQAYTVDVVPERGRGDVRVGLMMRRVSAVDA